MDGESDCKDGSDEIRGNHAERNCSKGLFQCDNHECIFIDLVCNGDKECSDGSDEVNCKEWECLPDYWKCANNLQCLHVKGVCGTLRGESDYYHCSDDSDEHNKLCGCPEETDWPCVNGDGCIATNKVCDGKNDCNDKSDEEESFCRAWNCSQGQWPCFDQLQNI